MRGGRRGTASLRVLALAGVLLLAGCPAQVTPPPRDDPRVLNLYSWAEYFPPAVIRAFEAETGIKVNYSVFDSNDVAETTLSAGQSGFDLVTVNVVPHLGRQIPKGLWQPIDRTRIPNAGNADPRLLELMQHVDPGNRYALPYMWGTVGIIYNRRQVTARLANAPLDSLDMILRPDTVAHFAGCGVSVLSSWVDMMPLLSDYVGQPGLPTDAAAIARVAAAFGRVRPMIRRITTSGYYDQLARGELCLAIGYSADAMVARRRAQELQNGVEIAFSQARETVPLYIDAYAIPATARHVEAALRFIDFTLRPEVGAELARSTGFAIANPAAVARLEPELRDNAIVYPPEDVRARFTLGRAFTMDETRFLSRTWLRMRTGH